MGKTCTWEKDSKSKKIFKPVYYSTSFLIRNRVCPENFMKRRFCPLILSPLSLSLEFYPLLRSAVSFPLADSSPVSLCGLFASKEAAEREAEGKASLLLPLFRGRGKEEQKQRQRGDKIKGQKSKRGLCPMQSKASCWQNVATYSFQSL